MVLDTESILREMARAVAHEQVGTWQVGVGLVDCEDTSAEAVVEVHNCFSEETGAADSC